MARPLVTSGPYSEALTGGTSFVTVGTALKHLALASCRMRLGLRHLEFQVVAVALIPVGWALYQPYSQPGMQGGDQGTWL
jgi:hypothetical protein